MKTIHDIEASRSEEVGELLRTSFARKDEIAARRIDVQGPYAELLTDEQRALAAAQKKAEMAQEELGAHRRDYKEATQAHNDAIRKRTAFLHKSLFHVQSAEAGMKAATASEAELREMLEYASLTDNKDMSKAVAPAAYKKGFGDILADYLREDESARELFDELLQAPSEETLQKRLADAETFFAPPTVTDMFTNYATAAH
jgi:hypothetical protein